jgi:r1t holin
MSFLAQSSFWIQTAERAVKTVAQTAVATITANATGLLDADWVTIGSVSGLAGLVSVLTSVGSGYVGDDDSPSLVE